jgi:hypothetical protein
LSPHLGDLTGRLPVALPAHKPLWFLLLALVAASHWQPGCTAAAPLLKLGVAARDITPTPPIWLAGYAARKRPADKVDHPLVAQALAFRNPTGERAVFVTVDNCEVSDTFTAPVLADLASKHGLRPGETMIVSSHTHAAPVLEGALSGMYPLAATDQDRLSQYGKELRERLVEVVGAALSELRPGRLEYGVGRCTFAMNRRSFATEQVTIGENPEGPVDWQVPVLRVVGTNGVLRAVVFGYACHATSIQGDDFYTVSPDYPGYARAHLESVLPGTVAMFVTGMGADANPAPRGSLLESRRHGLELAGAVMGVLSRPMRPVGGPGKLAYAEVELPLVTQPTREQLQQDAQSQDVYVRNRATACLRRLDAGKPLPGVRLPLSVFRLGDGLTFVAMGGEVVVDYALRFKRMFAADHPWTIGYAYHVPCYIPSARIVKEGGYEADSSFIYYGIYGPCKPAVEDVLVKKTSELLAAVR